MYWLFSNPSPNKRVARGVKFLDATRPGWALRVDRDRVDLRSRYDCVLAQVDDCNYFAVPEVRAHSGRVQTRWGWGTRHGFETGNDLDDLLVTQEWQRVIRMRLGAEILAA